MLILAVAALILLGILLLPLGVSGSAGTEGMSLAANIGPVKLRLLPRPERRPKKPKKKDSSKKAKAKKKITAEQIFAYIPVGARAFGRFRRKLRVDELRLWYQASSDDPADAALCYGRACAAAGTALGALSAAFDIRERDVRVSVDFSGDGQRILAGGKMSIRVWQLLYVGAASAIDFLRATKRLDNKHKIKSERNEGNGTSDRRYDGEDHVENKGDGGRQHHRGDAYNNA